MSAAERRSVEIVNMKGLHARASAALAREAMKYDAAVKIHFDGHAADANSIMDLLMLAASMGCVVEVSAEGPDAGAALDGVVALIMDRFGEEA